MSSSVMQFVRRFLPGSWEPAEDAQRETDRELLSRFVKLRTESAFAELIQRHGSMVMGVCRRVLRNEQDVEDAFQAVFLVLARRSNDINWQESIGGWLHETAVRVATHARARDLKRREHETRAVEMPSVSSRPMEVPASDLREIFDDEISKLHPKYQQPLILCYLEGKTHVEAAEELGWPIGSVKGRLARGREELRQRLVRRGVTLSAAAFALHLLQDTTSAAVSPQLAATTLACATSVLSAGSPTIQPGVGELVEYAIRNRPRRGLPVALIASFAAVLALIGGLRWVGNSPKNSSADRLNPLSVSISDLHAERKEIAKQNDPNNVFSGEWMVVSWLDRGQERNIPPNAAAGVQYGVMKLAIGKSDIELGLEIDSDRNPPAIDLKIMESGVPYKHFGIFEIVNDQVRIVWSPVGEMRPASLDVTEESTSVLVLRKIHD